MNYPIERNVALLRQHGVTTLVEFRSLPYSMWAEQFQKEALSRLLVTAPIAFVYLGREFGSRPEDAEFYDAEGHDDYEGRAQARDVQTDVDELVGLADEGPTAILCAEEDPSRCHRRLLVRPVLGQREITMLHIRGQGRVQNNDELGGRNP